MKKNKYIVGITGGIGSGKTTICRIIEHLGFPVYYSDLRAKQLIETNDEIIALYKKKFGNDIYNHGKLDRERVAEIFFKNEKIKNEIESVLHPLVINNFSEWVINEKSKIVFNENAILFESGGFKLMNTVVTVVAPENVKIKRIIDRDKATGQQIINRMKQQWDDERKTEMSEFVIYNDNFSLIIPQVISLLNELSQRIKQRG